MSCLQLLLPKAEQLCQKDPKGGIPTKVTYDHMGVSKNRGTPKSSILIRFSIINHPFWDTPILGNTHISVIYVIYCL